MGSGSWQRYADGTLTVKDVWKSFRTLSRPQRIFIGVMVVFCFLYILGILLIPLIVALWQVSKYRNSTLDLVRQGHCESVPGNNDMFGIGVRIATYIQTLLFPLVTFPRFTSASVAKGLATANMWFIIAFITAVAVMLHDSNTNILELYVVIVLGNGLTLMMLTFPVITSIGQTIFTELSQFIVLGIWKVCTTIFWWNKLPQSIQPLPGCEYYGYLLIRKELAPGSTLHIFHQVLNVYGWAVYVCVIGYTVLRMRMIFIFINRLSGMKAPGGVMGDLHREDFPSRNRMLLDFIFIFPIADFDDYVLLVKDEEALTSEDDLAENMETLAESSTPNNTESSDQDELATALVPEEDVEIRIPHAETRWEKFVPFLNHQYYNEEADTSSKPAELFLARLVPKVPRSVTIMALSYGLIIVIIPVEFILAINDIPDVNNVFQAGQLLALVGSIGVSWSVVAGWWTGSRREEIRKLRRTRLDPSDNEPEAISVIVSNDEDD